MKKMMKKCLTFAIMAVAFVSMAGMGSAAVRAQAGEPANDNYSVRMIAYTQQADLSLDIRREIWMSGIVPDFGYYEANGPQQFIEKIEFAIAAGIDHVILLCDRYSLFYNVLNTLRENAVRTTLIYDDSIYSCDEATDINNEFPEFNIIALDFEASGRNLADGIIQDMGNNGFQPENIVMFGNNISLESAAEELSYVYADIHSEHAVSLAHVYNTTRQYLQQGLINEGTALICLDPNAFPAMNQALNDLGYYLDAFYSMIAVDDNSLLPMYSNIVSTNFHQSIIDELLPLLTTNETVPPIFIQPVPLFGTGGLIYM